MKLKERENKELGRNDTKTKQGDLFWGKIIEENGIIL